MHHSKPHDIVLYSYCLDTKFPLPVLGDHVNKRHGFLLIQKNPDGYRIGEAAPLPSFHGILHSKIQEELIYFIKYQHLPQNCHALSQFAVDMLFVDDLYTNKNTDNNTKIIRKINALYHSTMSGHDMEHFQTIKLKVGRNSHQKDIDTLQYILDQKTNIRFRLDPNCLWSYTDTLEFWNKLHKASLIHTIEYIEDPVQNIENLSQLNDIPFALDMLFSISHLKYNPKAVILKPTLQGGWIETQNIQKQLRTKYPKLQMIISSTFESSIGMNALMHLADPHEVHGLDTLKYFAFPRQDLVCDPIKTIGDQLISTQTYYQKDDLRWDLLEKL